MKLQQSARVRPQPAAARAASWLRPKTWAYAVPGSRDLRIDFLRGFLVLAMIADHIGGDSLFNAISGNNSFLISAAEGFVFISGMLMGVVYGRRALKNGLQAGLLAVLRRAWFLYTTVLALTLGSLALYLFTNVPLFNDRSNGLGVATPLQAIVGAITMHYSFNGTDVLCVYVQLVAFAPIALYLLVSGRTRYLLLLSWVLWGVYQFYPDEAAVPWTVQNSIFPFATWQLLFYNGMALGFHRERLDSLARVLARRVVFIALDLAVVGLILLARAYHDGSLLHMGIPGLTTQNWDFLFNKSPLGAGRVVTFVIFAAFAQQLVSRFWVPLQWAFGWFLLPLGQSALLAYGSHLFLIGPAHVLGPYLQQALGDPTLTATMTQLTVLLVVQVLVKIQAGKHSFGLLLSVARRWLLAWMPLNAARRT